MNKYAFIGGLSRRLFTRGALGMGVKPGTAKAVGRFGETLGPLMLGSYLFRSENPLVSGVGQAMTFAPMFKGMIPRSARRDLMSSATKVKKPAPVPGYSGAQKTMNFEAPPVASKQKTMF